MAWLSGWQYRKTVPIPGGSEAVSGYAVSIVIHHGTGVDAPGHVYLNEHCRPDFADLRFTAADGITALPYWVESKTEGDQALVWVRVDAVPASPGTGQVYAYYGNATAASMSDGNATFLWFSHFDVDESARFTGATDKASYADSILTFRNTAATWAQLWSVDTFRQGSCIRTRMKRDIAYTQFGFGNTVPYENRVAEYPGTTRTKIQKAIDSSFTNSTEVTRSYDYRNTFNLHELKWLDGHLIMKVNGTIIVDWTTTTPTNDMLLLVQAYGEVTYFDWLAVRPIIATEPTASTAGAEEVGEAILDCEFVGSPRSGYRPLAVQFTDLSISNYPIESWLWDFGDGSTSIEQHPQHTYQYKGNYTVALTIGVQSGILYKTTTKIDYIAADVGLYDGRVIAVLSGVPTGFVPTPSETREGVDLAPLIAALSRGWMPHDYGGAAEISRLATGEIVGNRPTTGLVVVGIAHAAPEAGDLAGKYDMLPAAHAQRSGKNIIRGQGFISLDRDMLAQSVLGRFVQRFDGPVEVAEHYHLTQHKPWTSHYDRVGLSSETYSLRMIDGRPSTPPRFVSFVRHPEGVLIEWEPPEDRGTGEIAEYRLYRGPDEGSMAFLTAIAGEERHYFDVDAPEPSVYRIYAFNSVADSDGAAASVIVDPDTERVSLRDALTGEAWSGLPYAGWLGVRAIRLTPSTITILPAGRKRQIEAVIYPVDATVLDLAWSSSRPDIVSVDRDGIVTAHAAGRAVITAASVDGTGISAQVPIVSMPRLMVDDVADMLSERGFTHVYRRFAPDLPDACIVLRQLAGEAPDPSLEIARPALAVAVRSRDLGDASRTLKRLHDALHMITPIEVNGTHYYAIEALSTGQYEDKDRRGPRYVCTATFRIEKERRLGGAP